MPSFKAFNSVTGRNSFTLFEIRLENDFIVFRGNEHESSGQLLKGVVVLCLPAPLKIEDVHLRLTGTQHFGWTDSRVTSTGISSQRVDKTTTIFQHKWEPFVDGGPSGKSTVLKEGNYEWPFELLLPGDTCESVEGLPEANITYKIKATVARGKLAYDLHAYKRLRVIRTLEASALEVLHAMSVENIWPNKVEYSIVVRQKAVVFGSAIPLETRFTPLLKGLEINDITFKLMEVHEFHVQGLHGHVLREYKREKEITKWTLPVCREEHWHDMIEDTGQEGWMINAGLDLPQRLGKCMQDCNVQGIKIRHKLKLVVALLNPDGHVSELRATLPVTLFISPNMPLDEDGNLVHQFPQGSAAAEEANAIAPPGYGEHVLDQLYDEVDMSGMQTPAIQSGVSSPFSLRSRAGSHENLAAMVHSMAVPPAALSSRLQDMSLSQSPPSAFTSVVPGSGVNTPYATHHHGQESMNNSPPQSAPMTRRNSVAGGEEDEEEEDDEVGGEHPGQHTPEHIDFAKLSRVPSYQTARRTPVRGLSATFEGSVLPDYQTAISAPISTSSAVTSSPVADPMASIPEGMVAHLAEETSTSPPTRADLAHRRNQPSDFLSYLGGGDSDDRRRIYALQARERVS